MIVALANDAAEIFFDILALTGAGITGEGIMEPINAVLWLFFTAVFTWKAGFGSSTIVEFLVGILNFPFVPARTVSVGVGIWMANHPKAIVSEIAGELSVAEGGVEGLEGGAEKKLGGEAEKLGGQAAQGTAQAGGAGESGGSKASGKPSQAEGESLNEDMEEGEEDGGAKKKKNRSGDEMASPEEGNPLENLQENLYEKTEEESDEDQQQAA